MSHYGFQEHLSADFPSQLTVDVTEVCNLACAHCPHPSFKTGPAYAARHLDEDLNAKLVEEARDHGRGKCAYLRYTSSGEPLLHPGIHRMLAYAVTHSGARVTLTTNATVMNEACSEKLLASKVHLIDASLDAFEADTYARIRIRGSLEKTRRNVLSLIRLRNEARSRTKIVVSYVEQQANAGETEKFREYWIARGVDSVVIRRLHSAAGAVASIASALHERVAEGDRYPCLYPWERLLLAPTGHLQFCPEDWVHGSAFADYRRTTVRDAWRSHFMQELRAAHLRNRFSNHRFCGDCPDWQQTRWPGQGRSYSDLVRDLSREDGARSQ